MLVGEFKRMVLRELLERMRIHARLDYASQKTRSDKYLREEYVPILAVLKHKCISDTETIELGDEKEEWDARVNGVELYEIAQALPAEEHLMRKSVAGDSRTSMEVGNLKSGQLKKMEIVGVAAQIALLLKHANDHQQFPRVIIDAIQKKHERAYADKRSLFVAVSGDYSFEDDAVVEGWISEIRKATTLGNFIEIAIVEVERQKVFSVF